MTATGKLASAAYRACSQANLPAGHAVAGTKTLTLAAWIKASQWKQPEIVLQAAAALLHAAISHCLTPPQGKPPKALLGAGCRWFLTTGPSGRVHVSPIHGKAGFGLVSGYVELIK